ncbi:MAG: hypothetical protein ACK4PK_06690 [Alphaproteobacteria bacterium]
MKTPIGRKNKRKIRAGAAFNHPSAEMVNISNTCESLCYVKQPQRGLSNNRSAVCQTTTARFVKQPRTLP